MPRKFLVLQKWRFVHGRLFLIVRFRIPLTVNEWEEWGNPNEEKYCKYMMEYCPMQTVVKGGKYPACLLTGGLHDPRVQFWEPAKVSRFDAVSNCRTESREISPSSYSLQQRFGTCKTRRLDLFA